MDLERKYLLLLFAIGVVSKGVVKSTFGSNMSLILLLSVALYYWRMRQRDQTIYDDIARMQVEAAAKLDKLNGISDGKVNEMDLYVRKTRFQLEPEHASFITDRMHQYSRKFSGTQAERRKFLTRRKKRVPGEGDADENDVNAAAPVASRSAETSTKSRKSKKKVALEVTVEEAVDATL
uniref:Uncharacterized protein n=1 Tax=Globisporangium ultimum (strain ATCC 200006 / CBS 805.95 / DAOM BR144) TaxID=431595 RepID=K3X1C0_GLOUD